MSGKYGLIVANTEYSDPGLAQLTAPGKDAKELWRVLNSPDIGAFDDVMLVLNEDSGTVRERIEHFFSDKKPDDLLLFYFSGHGVRDENGALYLAVKNTNRNRLRSTGVGSAFVKDIMDECRSKRQVLILDCCNSGAFAQGTKAATGVSIGTATAFGGYGNVVLTASDSTQYAWEGDKVIGGETENSLFTHFLVKGLEGEADRDGDGQITVDELYEYAFEKVRGATSKQTPSKFATKQQGEIVLRMGMSIAEVKPIPLPAELIEDIENPRAAIRQEAVQQLIRLLNGKNLGLARSAREALENIAENDDSRTISRAAFDALEAGRQADQASQQNTELEKLASEEKRRADQAEKDRKAEAERLVAQKKEEQLAKQKLEVEMAVKAKAEKERKEKEEADRYAAQKSEEERAAKQKAEGELAAKVEKERKAKEEADRLVDQKAEEERAAREKMQREIAASASDLPIIVNAETSSAVQQKKPIPMGLMIGIGSVVLLILGGIGFSIFSNKGTAATEAPVVYTEMPAVEAPPATEIPPATEVPAVVDNSLPTNLLAQYLLDNSAKDELNNYPDITIGNAPFSDGGLYCNGIYLYGSDANPCDIQTPPITSLDYNNFSIGVDFKVDEYPSYDPMPVFVGGNDYRWAGAVIYQDGTIGIMFNNTNILLQCGGHYDLNSWHNLLVTYDGKVGTLYFDNEMLCTTEAFAIETGEDYDKMVSTTNLGNGSVLKGYIRDLKIYNVAITPDPAEAPASSGGIIFGSDFSDPNNSDWGDVSPVSLNFNNGELYVVTPDGGGWWIHPTVDFSQYGPDQTVQVALTYASDGNAGVFCRNQNEAFYLFLMNFEKSVAQIWYFDGSSFNELAEQSVTQSSKYNYIYAVCQGNSLVFYWNGEYAVDVTDDRLPDTGYAGLYVEATDPSLSGITIGFDDFYIGYP